MYEYTPPERIKRIKDLTGQKFGKLTAVRLLGRRTGLKTQRIFWLFRCDCGNEVEVSGSDVTFGRTTSCGCYRKATTSKNMTTHGATTGNRVPEYGVWCAMKARCVATSGPDHHDYSARGITVCDRWLNSFENFIEDMGPRPSPKHSIDRKDVNGNYRPDNCKWTTQKAQNNNKRNNVYINYKGQTYTMIQLVELLKLDYHSFKFRYRRQKLPLAEAIAKARRL